MVRPIAIATAAQEDKAARWWVPMIDGTARMGVMEFVLPAGVDPHAPALQQRCERADRASTTPGARSPSTGCNAGTGYCPTPTSSSTMRATASMLWALWA